MDTLVKEIIYKKRVIVGKATFLNKELIQLKITIDYNPFEVKTFSIYALQQDQDVNFFEDAKKKIDRDALHLTIKDLLISKGYEEI